MADEEAALVIDQQLVQLGRDRLRDAEAVADARKDFFERLRPVLAAGPFPRRTRL